MVDNKTVGIVILNYKDAETTTHLCSLIVKYSSIDKIVIVDNLSPDNSFTKLRLLSNEKVDVLKSDKNGGYSYGNNYGAFYLIKKYKIDVLIIANPDVEFEEDHIIDLVRSLNQEKLQAVAGIMKDPNGDISKWNGKIFNWAESLLDSTIILRRLLNNNSFDYAERDEEYIYVDFLPGSLFAIDANVFTVIGGFDDNVFLYFEESILRSKFDFYGYKMAISYHTSFIHNHSVSIRKSINRLAQINQYYISKEYYFERYNNIRGFKLLLLKIFDLYGLYVRKLIYRFVEN